MRILLLALMLAACAPLPVAPQPGRSSSIAATLIAVHNRERVAFGVPPLAWDPSLAAAASAFAAELASEGRLRHAPRSQRLGQGENLWIGTRGGYPLEAMVGGWSIERRQFRPGIFPAVSRTGHWADVGHFTQMVWPTTSRLGCGLASSARWDVLVCRYAPAGNVDGRWIGRR